LGVICGGTQRLPVQFQPFFLHSSAGSKRQATLAIPGASSACSSGCCLTALPSSPRCWLCWQAWRRRYALPALDNERRSLPPSPWSGFSQTKDLALRAEGEQPGPILWLLAAPIALASVKEKSIRTDAGALRRGDLCKPQGSGWPRSGGGGVAV